jgi:hypothetical protein
MEVRSKWSMGDGFVNNQTNQEFTQTKSSKLLKYSFGPPENYRSAINYASRLHDSTVSEQNKLKK